MFMYANNKNFIHGLRKSQKNDENYRMGRLFYCTVPFLGVPGVFLLTNYRTVNECTYVALLSYLNNNITTSVVEPEPEPKLFRSRNRNRIK
jgi:hypothetical protein